MTADDYQPFFIAAAGATGALVGLLFVAVSVIPDQALRAGTRAEFGSRAAAALLVFTNALMLSLAALVPGATLGWWLAALGFVVLAFAAATLRSARGGTLLLIAALTAIGGVEIFAGVELLRGHQHALEWAAYAVIADLAFGIARSWQLLGLRDTGLTASLRILFGLDTPRRDARTDEEPAGPGAG